MVNFCISIQSINKMAGLYLFILCNFKVTVVINLYGLFVVGLTCKNVVKQQAPVVQTLDSAIHRIQWITQLVFLILIHWIVIYPVDSAIQRLNNRGLFYTTSSAHLASSFNVL